MFNYRKIVKMLPLLTIAVGFVGCHHNITANSTPLPISAVQDIGCFWVVCFDKSGKPELRNHEISISKYVRENWSSESEFKKAYNNVALWKEDAHDSKKYTFYIPRNKVKAVENVLNADYPSDVPTSDEIRILEDDPVSRKQKIEVRSVRDDSTYTSIYAVDGNSVTPLKYGDLIKRDGVLAVGVGLKYMLIFYLLARVALWVVDRSYAARVTNSPDSTA